MRETGGPSWSGAVHGTAGRGAVFALVRAWAAGLVVLFISEYVQVTYFYGTFESAERLESFGGRLLVVHLPAAL